MKLQVIVLKPLIALVIFFISNISICYANEFEKQSLDSLNIGTTVKQKFSNPNVTDKQAVSTLQLTQSQNSKRRVVKILSIDGGGVRGIIPAFLLENLEARLPPGQRISELFDIIAGTSAGGIIALMLTVPDEEGNKPKYTAKYIASEVASFSQEAFSRSLWQIVKSAGGWIGSKYNEKPLKNRLNNYFGNSKLSQLVTNVIVPAYDIERDKTWFFKTSRARREDLRDYYLCDLAYATSAAPTYFRPAQIKDTTEKLELVLIDGAVSANNPTLAAIVHAVELYGTDIDLFVVSMGTGTNYGAVNKRLPYKDVKNSGKLGWVSEIASLLMYAATAVTDYEAYYVLNYKKPQYYFRFQTTLEPEDALFDDASPENIQNLKNYANKMIQENDSHLEYIAKILCNHYSLLPEEREPQAFR